MTLVHTEFTLTHCLSQLAGVHPKALGNNPNLGNLQEMLEKERSGALHHYQK